MSLIGGLPRCHDPPDDDPIRGAFAPVDQGIDQGVPRVRSTGRTARVGFAETTQGGREVGTTQVRTDESSERVESAGVLTGQTVLVIGGSSGIGLETARRARAEGADVIITARNADRLQSAGLELGASIAAFAHICEWQVIQVAVDGIPAFEDFSTIVWQ